MSAGVPRKTIRLTVALQIFAMTALLLAANYFSFGHYARADFSRSQKFVLSDQTKRVLRELKMPVKVTVFFSDTTVTPETLLAPDVRNLFKELLFSSRKQKFEVEYVDPTRDLSRARELQGQYKFTADENVIILEYDGRTKFIPVADMADFDLSPVTMGDQPRLIAFKGEQAITNGLIALLNPDKKKVYFLEGHGEPTAAGALSTFADYVQRQNATIQPLSLGSADSIPTDSAMLAIVAPQTDFNEREISILEQYWSRRDGRLLILLDPNANTPRLLAFLARLGCIPHDTRVLRIYRLPFATGILREVTAEFLPRNAVTKRLVGLSLFLPGATQSLGLDLEQAKVANVQLWPLIQAGEEFWGETQYVTDENKGVRYDDGVDVGQPVYIALAAARGGVSDDRVEVESSKLIVVGSSQFAFDAAPITTTGLDFLLSASNWLLDRGDRTGVMPKAVQHFNLNLTDEQFRWITLYILIIMPGIVALFGLIAWLRRRA